MVSKAMRAAAKLHKVMRTPALWELAPKSEVKDTNPKDSVGVRKVPFSTLSAPVIAEVGLGMLEGARKYRRHNYRIAGVKASVYYDATIRHLTGWWEGEDIDPASRLSHVTKAISSLFVLRDAMMNDKWTDDRPPPFKNQNWVADMNKLAGEIIDLYPDGKPPYTKADVMPLIQAIVPIIISEVMSKRAEPHEHSTRSRGAVSTRKPRAPARHHKRRSS